MRRPISLLLAAGAVAAMSAALALAAPGELRFPISTADLEAHHTALFASADGNGDGLIDADEFAGLEPRRGGHPGMHGPRAHGSLHAPEAAQAEVFAALDSNADGSLSPEEFAWEKQRAARRQVMKQQMFARLDENGDGFLDPDEFPPRRMLNHDADGDGQITRQELRDGRHQRRHPDG